MAAIATASLRCGSSMAQRQRAAFSHLGGSWELRTCEKISNVLCRLVRYFDDFDVYLYKSLHFCILISAPNCEDGHIDINQKQLCCPSHHFKPQKASQVGLPSHTSSLKLSQHPLQCSRARFLNQPRCTVSWPCINR